MNKELANIVVDAVFNYNPYIGIDYDDALRETQNMLKTRAGAYDIIEQLVEMLNEALL